jgi:hypothetical protein
MTTKPYPIEVGAAAADAAAKLSTEAAETKQTEQQTPQDPRVDKALGIFSDLNALEVTPGAQIGAREITSVVPVRKPKPNEFVQVHPTYSLTAVIYEDRDEREPYYVLKEFASLMIAGAKTKLLALAVNQLGEGFIWPVPLDAESSRRNDWNESHRAAYHQAKTDWTKIVAGRDRYHVYVAEGEMPPPRWPEKEFKELLAIGFHNRIIDRLDHPIIKDMYGRK